MKIFTEFKIWSGEFETENCDSALTNCPLFFSRQDVLSSAVVLKMEFGSGLEHLDLERAPVVLLIFPRNFSLERNGIALNYSKKY